MGWQPSPLLTFVLTLESRTFPGIDLAFGVFPTWLPTGFALWVWGGGRGAWPSAAPHDTGGGALLCGGALWWCLGPAPPPTGDLVGCPAHCCPQEHGSGLAVGPKAGPLPW